MPIHPGRRQFLLSALAAMVTAWLSGCRPGEERVEVGETADPIAAILASQFDYLNLEPAAVDAFIRDFRSRADRQTLAWEETDWDAFTYAVSSQFLMSSDFFWHDADESRLISYRAYYDPYRGCTSPFAKLG